VLAELKAALAGEHLAIWPYTALSETGTGRAQAGVTRSFPNSPARLVSPPRLRSNSAQLSLSLQHVGAALCRLRNPVRHASAFVSSGFGWRGGCFHEGVDVAAEAGVAVAAAAHGLVTYAGWNGAYGQLLCLSHGHGFSTRCVPLRGLTATVEGPSFERSTGHTR
jgi:murein DD-endopeptidase MepM/ murein hydrolase activator NlpD